MNSTEPLRRLLLENPLPRGALATTLALSGTGVILEGIASALLIPAARAGVTLDFSTLRSDAMLLRLTAHLPFPNSADDKVLFTCLLATIAVLTLAKTALFHQSAMRFTVAAHDWADALRDRLFTQCLKTDKAFQDSKSPVHVNSVLTLHLDRIVGQFVSLQDAALHAALTGVYAVILLAISWRLAALVALAFPIVHFSTALLAGRLRARSTEDAAIQSELSSLIQGAMRNAPFIRSSHGEDFSAQKARQLSRRHESLQAEIDIHLHLTPRLQESVFVLMLLACLMGAAVFLGPQAAGEIPSLLVFVYVARRAAISAAGLARIRNGLASIEGALLQVKEFFEDTRRLQAPAGRAVFGGLVQGIEFRGLSHRFPDGTVALNSLSLTVRCGERVAIVGPSGGGKSTLMHLLLKVYTPPPGSIFLDGTDLLEFSAASLANHWAFVPQVPPSISGTVREYLTFPGKPSSDGDGALWHVLSDVGLGARVNAIPNRLDSHLSADGFGLSGGEVQRLAIARALLKSPGILLLDEPTSALDSESESLVREAIRRISSGRTAIVIAHRLSTIRLADRIFVVEQGALVQTGTFESLSKVPGRFQAMLAADEFIN